MQKWNIYCHCCGRKLGIITRTKMFILSENAKNPHLNPLNNNKTGYVDCKKCNLEAPLKFRKYK